MCASLFYSVNEANKGSYTLRINVLTLMLAMALSTSFRIQFMKRIGTISVVQSAISYRQFTVDKRVFF